MNTMRTTDNNHGILQNIVCNDTDYYVRARAVTKIFDMEILCGILQLDNLSERS